MFIKESFLVVFIFLSTFLRAQDSIPAGSSGFYTPPRKGQMWDTWLYYHNKTYYLYYIGGPLGKWDAHELATSSDGVNWTFKKEIIKPLSGTEWIGTGQLWKSPNFENDSIWISNYSEWVNGKQDIMFATSHDLTNWKKVSGNKRFKQDTRWYKADGRWDCIDVVKGDDGYLYGYFTADPDPEKVDYEYCGFGFARSSDGITWEALPPVKGDLHGEFGGIEKIGEKYYITISEGRIGIGDSFKGPFYGQKKNSNMFDGDIYFPRFFHGSATADGRPLVNHFYKNGIVYSAPLKDIEIDAEDILRLKWWKGNSVLKNKSLNAGYIGYNNLINLLETNFYPERTYVIEGSVRLSNKPDSHDQRGLVFSQEENNGDYILFFRDRTSFGNYVIEDNVITYQEKNSVARDMDYGTIQNFRVVLCNDMVEVYIDDYLTVIQRVKLNEKIGIITGEDVNSFTNVKIWSNH